MGGGGGWGVKPYPHFLGSCHALFVVNLGFKSLTLRMVLCADVQVCFVITYANVLCCIPIIIELLDLRAVMDSIKASSLYIAQLFSDV